MTPTFWEGRRVLLTGHTGFKGAWAAAMLESAGAQVTGVALPPPDGPNLWKLIDGRLRVDGRTADLRDQSATAKICLEAAPQIVIHMAAQAQVRQSYADPHETWSSNLMGTVNLLEAVRRVDGVEVVLVVTSDKVYSNQSDGVAFSEQSRLGGSDPYSASKAAVEVIVKAYADSFFRPRGVPIATARGGNVLGGGDFASDRLVPDVFRSTQAQQPVELRYPQARRPWQHVLDCVSGYLRYVEHLHGQKVAEPPALNFGPAPDASISVAEVADRVGRAMGNEHPWRPASGDAPPEKHVLHLDCGLSREVLGWTSRLDVAATLTWTAEWYAAHASGEDALSLVRSQIRRYQRAGS